MMASLRASANRALRIVERAAMPSAHDFSLSETAYRVSMTFEASLQRDANFHIAAFRDAATVVNFTRLMPSGNEAEISANVMRYLEPVRIIGCPKASRL
jgi:lysylphosphatidylglycerol synthetase-like protein (DUF2156 family)